MNLTFFLFIIIISSRAAAVIATPTHPHMPSEEAVEPAELWSDHMAGSEYPAWIVAVA